MEFVNRIQELDRLRRLARRGKGGMAVVWGRRRMGKTRLLLEWVDQHKGIYYAADESTATLQRKYFAMALEQALKGFSDVTYPDWTALLSRLAADAIHAKWKGPLVIDELPYLISVSPELPSVLQKFIDHDAKKANLLVVFSGSSQRMMQGAILNSSAPLYGRADEIIKLGPISVSYMKEALGLKNPREIVEYYSIWGGVPRYWELLEKNKQSFLESIDKLVLDPMGPLHQEPHRLLLEELPSAIHLRPILDAIGLGAQRLTEIAARIGQPATSLMRPIQRLIELDLIEREIPYGTSPNSSKKTLYKIKDPFIRFWFTAVGPNRSLYTQAAASNRKRLVKEAFPRLFSIMWEDLCRLAVPLLTKKLGGVDFEQAGRYWDRRGPEWDILSISLDRTTLLIGEAKWTAKMPTSTWLKNTMQGLKNKGIPPIQRPENMKVMHVLFIPEKPKQIPVVQGVKLIDAKDVLKALI